MCTSQHCMEMMYSVWEIATGGKCTIEHMYVQSFVRYVYSTNSVKRTAGLVAKMEQREMMLLLLLLLRWKWLGTVFFGSVNVASWSPIATFSSKMNSV